MIDARLRKRMNQLIVDDSSLPLPRQFMNSLDTSVLISYVTDVNYSSFIIKEEDNEQATTYVHTFGILIEDNRKR